MLTQSETLTFKKTVQATPAELFRAFTNARVLNGWLSNSAEIDARKGGRIYLWWDEGYYAAGMFTSFDRDKNLSFTMNDSSGSASEVRVTFDPDGGGTTVKVIQSGERADAKMSSKWDEWLENLQSLVETGIDLRLARRPMFGLNAADVLSPELAARLGVPIKEGLWLGGLMDGMGAKAAGLQKDDVVVSLGGKDTPNFPGFVAAIQPHRAGDKVEVIFYRGPERHAVQVELSSRPMNEPPATPKEAAEKARASYAEVDAELAKLFQGVTESQAEHRSEPDGWNAKEVIAHLIAGERATQVGIAVLAEDADTDLQYFANSSERVKPLVKAYSTLPALLEELRRSEQVIVEMVATLSDKAVAHKDNYRQIADAATNFADHHREHFREIERLLTSAKG